MGGFRVRAPLYAAALAAGGAFAILFTGETYDGADGGFGRFSVVAIIAGYKAHLPLLLAAAVAVAVGSADRYRFVLLFPATALYTVLAVYGRMPLFSLSEWREFLVQIGNDVYDAAGVMYAEPIPYDLAPGLFVVLIPVVMIVVAFATSATLYEESPVISVAILGLTIGVLSTISFEDGAGPFFAVFLVSGVALLLSSSVVGRESPGRPGLVAGALVVALVLGVPKMPLSDATLSPGLIDWTRIGTGGTSRLDVQADVGDYLTAGRDAELMRIRSSEPLLWRGGTLDYFDGVRWSDTIEPGAEDGEEIAPGIETHPVRQRVQVLNAQTDLIFGGYKIITTDLISAELNSDGSWSVPGPLEQNTSYEVISEVPQPTAAQLRGAGTFYPPLVEEKFLQLPEGTPPVVAETARQIERDYQPQTPYDRARAIERYLIYDGDFVYNLDVSYRRADKAIEEFLGDDREGFCTQFATSMALLLREMGVPSRVVYGSTQGQEVEPGEYVVTGSNMHTWVEAYFPGVGWYPFDPTPGFTMPSTMQANAPRLELPITQQGPGLVNPNVSQRTRSGEETPRQRQEASRDSAASTSEGTVPAWPLLVLLPVLFVAAVPLAKSALLARGHPEDLYRDLTGRLRDVLPPGRGIIADSPALTPTERVLLLAGAVGVEEGPMEGFARAYSEHLYSPRSAPNGSRHVSSAYRRAVLAFGRLPFWRRALGAVNPASLLVRAKRSASAYRTRLGKTRLAKSLRALRGRLRRSAGTPR